jgi:hypothetical protein
MYRLPQVMINPGQLIEGHQKIKEKCLTCHVPYKGIGNDKCISCHKLSEIGKESMYQTLKNNRTGKILFHKGLANQKCSGCHTDHKGRYPEASVNSFNHEMLGTANRNNCNNCHGKPLNDLHKPLSSACHSCHKTAGWKTDLSFDHEMIHGADKRNCAGCHKKPDNDYHQFIKSNCGKCHNLNKWKPSSFDHSTYFRLDSDHQTTCKTCHQNNNFNTFTCYGCHEHSERNIKAEHNEEGIYGFNDCAGCHKSGDKYGINMNGNEGGRLNQKENNKAREQHHSEEDDD